MPPRILEIRAASMIALEYNVRSEGQAGRH